MSRLISIVIPLFNEGLHIEESLNKIETEVLKTGLNYELIVIDDGSSDDTWEIITNRKKNYPQLKAVRFSRHFGKESALCAGLDEAAGDAVIVIDGDLQHPPELIPQMLFLWEHEGYEIVECVKSVRGQEPSVKKLGASTFYTLLNKLSGYNLNGASDYKLLDRKVVSAWQQMGESNVFFRGMTAWLGFKTTRLDFTVGERAAGNSQWSLLHLWRLAITALVSFSSLPLRIVTILGAVFLLVSIILGMQTFYMKFTGAAITGFTTVILLLLIIGSIVMLSLGIIGEYIAAIYLEVKRRPRYIVTERTDVR
ncbi:MAG: glycosyltransferase family 2 protein [Syntrophomonadaceae bacterium]|nr:glycosyltransferase family 2 protein [Syntrophomonadaceae bacterium]MDD3890128.1 glycosyltransferase family 2 protein [Syntrophomonadaceae bacterium]MDD4549064.1 glycosyltransferase family 2 protein [Syntrophomonadaceae bacterium]